MSKQVRVRFAPSPTGPLHMGGVRTALYNFLFMAFNLIPIPPFDGSRVALAFLPPKAYFGLMKYERQIMIGLLVALLALSRLGFSPFSWIANELTIAVANPVYKLFLNLFSSLI